MAAKLKHVVVWFEIPAANFERAVGFYENLMGYQLRREDMGGMKNGVFPYSEGTISGCVMENPGKAGKDGVIIYLNCNGFLDEAVNRVGKAGGKLCGPMHELPGDMGRFIHIEDTEGNRVGLHSIP